MPVVFFPKHLNLNLLTTIILVGRIASQSQLAGESSLG